MCSINIFINTMLLLVALRKCNFSTAFNYGLDSDQSEEEEVSVSEHDYSIYRKKNNSSTSKNRTTSKIPSPTYRNSENRASRFVNVYIFNVTNPDDITEHVKPKLNQIGPFKYKLNLVQMEQPDDKLRTYKYIKKYSFQYDKSVKLNETDRVNIINAPYIRMVHAIAAASNSYRTNNDTDKMMAAINSSLILQNVSVSDIVTDGINVFHFYRKLRHFNLSILDYPTEFENNVFKFFPEEIDIDIFESEETIKKVTGITSVSSKKYELGCWKQSCNKINGTDGLLLDKAFGTITTKTKPLEIFYPDLYRAIKLNFSEEINGLYVYTLAKNVFGNTSRNKENHCFCTLESCKFKSGVLDVSSCKHNFPLVYSLPHFLDADESFRKPFEGLSPNRGNHEMFYRIDPFTGEVLYSIRRLQQNIWLKSLQRSMNNSDYVYKSKGLDNAIFPVLWTEETFELLVKMERKNKTVTTKKPRTKGDGDKCKNNSFSSLKMPFQSHYSLSILIFALMV